ncbi:MAG: hypothetical protein EXX96DRAFT_577449 [Benjaminiella poitrasii]|nr:MAG: hypothetical protein EXX96DRAFT_577449 [Benjaminiella poitrasii]
MPQKLRNSPRVAKKLTAPPSVATASVLRSKIPVPPRPAPSPAAPPPSDSPVSPSAAPPTAPPATSMSPPPFPSADRFAPQVTLPPLQLQSVLTLPEWALDFQAKLRHYDEQFALYNDRLQEVESLAVANARLQSELSDAQQLIAQLQAEVAHLRSGRVSGVSSGCASVPSVLSGDAGTASSAADTDARMGDSDFPPLCRI